MSRHWFVSDDLVADHIRQRAEAVALAERVNRRLSGLPLKTSDHGTNAIRRPLQGGEIEEPLAARAGELERVGPRLNGSDRRQLLTRSDQVHVGGGTLQPLCQMLLKHVQLGKPALKEPREIGHEASRG